MVCTTLRPTTLPHTEIEKWQDCASFVGDHLIYEPLEAPTLIVSPFEFLTYMYVVVKNFRMGKMIFLRQIA